jgi:hypothetical protein
MRSTDLFGKPVAHVHAEKTISKEPRGPGLKVSILEYFRDHRFEAFVIMDIVRTFSDKKEDRVREVITSLKRHGYLVSTGESRGDGIDNQCLIINQHKR